MPLLSPPSLKILHLTGNPWTEDSWEALQDTVNERRLTLCLSAEQDWRATRALFGQGLKACYGVSNQRLVFIRPGLPQLPKAN